MAADIETGDWLVEITPEALTEIERLALFFTDNPLPLLHRRLDQFDLPACRALMTQMKSILDDGVGFAVLDRLPMEALPIDTLVEVYWVLGQCIGRPVAQKWNGQMIYDVCDTGADYAYGTRGSHTSVELVFHTDNAFARMLPDYVGLLCRNPAKSGGVSRFCSLYSVHQRLLQQYPGQLARLYQPMLSTARRNIATARRRFAWRLTSAGAKGACLRAPIRRWCARATKSPVKPWTQR